MANIIKERTIALHRAVKGQSGKFSKLKSSKLMLWFSGLAENFWKVSLSGVVVFLCLFLFVYCRSIPENAAPLKTIIHPEKEAELPIIKMTSSGTLPASFPEITQKKQPDVSDYKNLQTIQNLHYPGNRLQGIFWRESEFGSKVYLTFDDGPNLSKIGTDPDITVTESIMKTLKDRHLNGAFFINGKNLEYKNDAEKEKLKRILLRLLNEGNLLGNHSYHHFNLARGKFIDGMDDIQETAEEYLSTQRALDELLGFHYPLILTRPPYAEPGRTESLDFWLMQKKYYLISLQFDSYDYAYSETGKWNSQSIQERVDKLLKEHKSGGVLLLHELDSTARLLPDLIDKIILGKGTSISTLDVLLNEKYGRKS